MYVDIEISQSDDAYFSKDGDKVGQYFEISSCQSKNAEHLTLWANNQISYGLLKISIYAVQIP